MPQETKSKIEAAAGEEAARAMFMGMREADIVSMTVPAAAAVA